MKKYSGYKYQIQQELINQGWEIFEIGSTDAWWDDEHWIVQHKYKPEIKVYLCFIVDPMIEGERKKGQGIYEIRFSDNFCGNCILTV